MRNSLQRWWGILALLTSLTGAATAAPVTYAFTGSVSDDPFGVGLASFSGTYTFDSAAVDLVVGSQTGSYTSSGVAFGIAVDFDGGAVSVDLYGLPTVRNIGVADNFAGPVDRHPIQRSSSVRPSPRPCSSSLAGLLCAPPSPDALTLARRPL